MAVNAIGAGPDWSQGGKQLLLRQSGDMVLGLTQGNMLKRKTVGTLERETSRQNTHTFVMEKKRPRTTPFVTPTISQQHMHIHA